VVCEGRCARLAWVLRVRDRDLNDRCGREAHQATPVAKLIRGSRAWFIVRSRSGELGSSPGRNSTLLSEFVGIVGDFTEVVGIVDDFSIRSQKRCHANGRAA
jgi:hypothetical protein